MIKTATNKSVILPLMTAFAFSLAVVTFSISADDKGTKIQSKTKETELQKQARILATLGGNARYCRTDKEVIDEFVGKAQGKLNLMAKDEYEKVFVTVEFKNLLAANSIKPPKEPCNKIRDKVKIFLRSVS